MRESPDSSETYQRAESAERTPPQQGGELSRLFNQIERDTAAHREAFSRILSDLAGAQLESVEELREFKRTFHAICDRLGVRPRLPDGRGATLQIAGIADGKGYAYLVHKQKMHSCACGFNTIPPLEIR